MGVPALLNIQHMSVSNTTLQPLHVIQLTDTIVIPMSEACKTSLRTMGVEDLPLGTSILGSPMPIVEDPFICSGNQTWQYCFVVCKPLTKGGHVP
jgi:hypothetical protein